MTKTKFRPCGDRVLVRPAAPKGETKVGGIIIPENAKEKPLEGVVVAVGRGRLAASGRTEVECCVGDTIVFAKYAGSEIKIDDEDHLILHSDDVIGVLEGA